MARQELLATIRDRYRESSKKDKGRILDEFIAVTGHHRKHGIRLLGQSREAGEKLSMIQGRRIYDEAVREAVILTWEATDRMCGKRLKAALPHLVDSMERHGHLDLDPEVRERLLAASAATLAGCSNRSVAPCPAGAGGGVICPQAATFRCGPLPIGTVPRLDSWRSTWWLTAATTWEAPLSTAWWRPTYAPGGPRPFPCWPESNPWWLQDWWLQDWRPSGSNCPSPSAALTRTTTACSSTQPSPSTAASVASSSPAPGPAARTTRRGLSRRTGRSSGASSATVVTRARWRGRPWRICTGRCAGM